MHFDFFHHWSRKAFNQYTLRTFGLTYNIENASGYVTRIEHPSLGTRILIWTNPKTDVSVFAHECLHAAYFTLGYVGVIVTAKNHEVLAYLMTELMREVPKAIDR